MVGRAQLLRNRRILEGHHPGTMAPPAPRDWLIYIPEEGHWPIKGKHRTRDEATKAYLKWAKRKRLPKGSIVMEGIFD
jgi:hypothetical protein